MIFIVTKYSFQGGNGSKEKGSSQKSGCQKKSKNRKNFGP
jgi:hypothetical protein